MYNIIRLTYILLGTLLITTGCNEKTQTNEEKLSKIMEVQKIEEPDTDETIELYGFNIPCYLIYITDSEPIDYKSTPYPYMSWLTDRDMLRLALNDQYPENGGDSYRLENFLALKYDKGTTEILMAKFKTRETEVIDPKDGTYIMFSTGTDDTRVVSIGDIEDLQKLNTPENQLPPAYELK